MVSPEAAKGTTFILFLDYFLFGERLRILQTCALTGSKCKSFALEKVILNFYKAEYTPFMMNVSIIIFLTCTLSFFNW